MLRRNNKAEMAVGTLIIFIAMVLVAAIAAGVVIQTATALQNKALLTGERAKAQVGTGIQTILIYGEDGNDKDLESFYMKLKLSPGSDALKFEDMLLEVDTTTSSSDNIYGEQFREMDLNTWYQFDSDKVDLNGDSYPDYIRFNGTSNGNMSYTFLFNISNESATESFIVTVPVTMSADSLTTNLSAASAALPFEMEMFGSTITDGTNKYGTLQVVGKSYTSNQLADDTVVLVSHGSALEQGAYSVDYLLKGTTWKDGYLQRGDIVKMVMIAPHIIQEDEELDVRIVPKTGSPRSVAIVVPDLVNAKRVYMFS